MPVSGRLQPRASRRLQRGKLCIRPDCQQEPADDAVPVGQKQREAGSGSWGGGVGKKSRLRRIAALS